MTRHYYNQQCEAQIAAAPLGSRLLLHSCCGPCSTAVLEQLGEHFAVTLYFYNPNILPTDEYQNRLDAQRTVVDRLATRYPVQWIAVPYNPAPFRSAIEGLEAEPEGGNRCTHCFFLRLAETARLAKEQGFLYFTTTLSVSPRKDANRLNEIGMALGETYGLSYLAADFKKKGGYQRSIELAKTLQLYRQTYCGCQAPSVDSAL